MHISQPSLWDNVPLENGYRRLAELRFTQALEDFRQAVQAGAEDFVEIRACVQAVRYWQQRIEASPPPATEQLLEDYAGFNFTGKLNAIRKALLIRIIDLSQQQRDMEPALFRTAFDQLLSLGAFARAGQLVQDYIRKYPENHALLYLLARAQWLDENKVEAYRSYTMALLRCPADSLAETVEPANLKDLIGRHGAHMAPAYGWINDLLPFVEAKDIAEPEDPTHQHALASYDLLQKAQKSFGKSGTSKEHIDYRKELQKHDGPLFMAYLNRLNRR